MKKSKLTTQALFPLSHVLMGEDPEERAFLHGSALKPSPLTPLPSLRKRKTELLQNKLLANYFLLLSILAHGLLLLLFIKWIMPKSTPIPAAALSTYIYSASYQSPKKSQNFSLEANQTKVKQQHLAKKAKIMKMDSKKIKTEPLQKTQSLNQQTVKTKKDRPVMNKEKDLSAENKVTLNHQDKSSTAAKAELHNTLLTLLHREIAAKQIYPESAQALNQTGIVRVGFNLAPTGQLSHIKIIKSSGFIDLDEAAITAVQQISPVKGVDHYLQQQDYFSVEVIFANS